MGYACPVCGAEQVDGVHLANHLAVTASLGRPDHEAWLEEHAPDWAENTPDALADRVVEYAPEIDTPEFETEGGGRPETGFEEQLAARSRQPGRGELTGGATGARARGGSGQREPRSDEVESVLSEARELTERMLDDGAEEDGTDDDGPSDAASDRDENA